MLTQGLDKRLRLHGKPLQDWKKFLDMTCHPLNPDNMPPDQQYVMKAFQGLVDWTINNEETICQLITSESASSTCKSQLRLLPYWEESSLEA